jgi:hypothetical protein
MTFRLLGRGVMMGVKTPLAAEADAMVSVESGPGESARVARRG